MKMIMSCLSEDTEFIDAAKKEFGEYIPVETYTVSGITGYDTVMLILTAANALEALVVPFIVMHMTNNKDDEIKSKRTVSIDMNGKDLVRFEFEGCNEETVREIVGEVLKKL